jgi:hypothetical protein
MRSFCPSESDSSISAVGNVVRSSFDGVSIPALVVEASLAHRVTRSGLAVKTIVVVAWV